MKKDALVPTNQELINQLEVDKRRNEADTEMINEQLYYLKYQLEETGPKCNRDWLKRWAAASSAFFIGALFWSSPALWLAWTISTITTLVLFAHKSNNESAYARLANEIKDREDGLLKLDEAYNDIRFRLAEKNPIYGVADEEASRAKLRQLEAELKKEKK